MADADSQAASTAAAAKPIPAWRYKTGLGLFILGNIGAIAAPILLPILGVNAAYIPVGMIAAELVILSSVLFLGWSGLKQLKNKMFGYFKANPDAPPVGQSRHRLGIIMTFVLPLGLEILAVLLVFVSVARVTPADPFPVVGGLGYDAQVWTFAGLFIASFVIFVAGLFVLGDHWWGRFCELFVWQGGRSMKKGTP